MKKKSARKSSKTRSLPKQHRSIFFRFLGLFTLIILFVVVAGKSQNGKTAPNVLGLSLIAQYMQQGGFSGGTSVSGGAGSSQAPKQTQSPQQVQQNQQGGSGGQKTPKQGQQLNIIQQYQQTQPGGSSQPPSQQTQGNSPALNNQNVQPSQQGKQAGGTQIPQQQTQQIQGGSNANQQQYQQFQQQIQIDAAKSGVQYKGSFPTTSQQPQTTGGFQPMPGVNNFPTVTGNLNVKTQSGTSINLNEGSTKVQLSTENSTMNLKAKKSDGTEVELRQDALEKVNTAIQLETGSTISQTGNQTILSRGQVSAQTSLPVSFDISQKSFSVQTSSGEKTITVLPDEAVAKALQSGSMGNVRAGSTKTTLTELNGQAVFAVQGSSSQKFLGLFPFSVPKTTNISAETGNVVFTQQSITSRLLNALSF